MVKLYRSTQYSTWWFAFSPKIGWVMFPAEVAGWEKRKPASKFDLNGLREIPIRQGFNTGIPGAPESSALGTSA